MGKHINPELPTASFLVEKLPWMKDAACRGMPTELFFYSGVHIPEARAARNHELAKVCGSCPVRRECFEQAMREEASAPGGRYGYRGCTTPTQRRKVYRSGGWTGDPKKIPLA